MKNHTMKLNPEPFMAIKNGTKTIEMRLYDLKRQLICKGDIIEFVNTQNKNDKIKVIVKALHTYKSFDELYEKFDKISLGYRAYESALPSDMLKYYSKDEIAEYGVVGIEVEMLFK